MACPKCGRQATEYDADKWQCLHCGIKFVYKEEKAPVVNVHQLYQSGETVRPVMCCPKCGSTNVRLKSLDDSRRGEFNIFGVLMLGGIWKETVQCLACGEMFFTPKGIQLIAAERERKKQLPPAKPFWTGTMRTRLVLLTGIVVMLAGIIACCLAIK
jgi:DNA-directed RNA polymerase subunit RPC12/RpoP